MNHRVDSAYDHIKYLWFTEAKQVFKANILYANNVKLQLIL